MDDIDSTRMLIRVEQGKRASARRRERARCRAVLTSPHAAKSPGVAMYLALQTLLPRRVSPPGAAAFRYLGV